MAEGISGVKIYCVLPCFWICTASFLPLIDDSTIDLLVSYN